MSLCPVCNITLVQVEEADVCAASCPTCRGTWISSMALERRTHLEISPDQPHIATAPLAELAETVTHSNSTAPLPCPICREMMTKDRFNPNIPVQIDRCNACEYIWLDAGEQGLLIQLYRELVASPSAAGNAPTPAQQEKIARLQQSHADRSSSTYSSGPSAADIATNVASAVFTILLEILLTPPGYHRHRW